MDKKIGREFFERPADVVARELLGCVLARRIGGKILKARIVETEAYFDEKDPASRARQKGDLRKTMLMDSGTILVYGVHNNWLMNFVTGNAGKAEAVLIRALEPLNFEKNLSGPGLLTKGMDINKAFHKKNIFDCKTLWLGVSKDKVLEICESFRVGVKKDLDEHMRFYIKESKHVSCK